MTPSNHHQITIGVPLEDGPGGEPKAPPNLSRNGHLPLRCQSRLRKLHTVHYHGKE